MRSLARSPHRDIMYVLLVFIAEVVVSGHDHAYERFAPQSPSEA